VHNSRYHKLTFFVVTNWNKDWKPGPYPKTPAEREAAAKKYGLRPEDYDAYEEGSGGMLCILTAGDCLRPRSHRGSS